jgi:uncharacterized protein YciI
MEEVGMRVIARIAPGPNWLADRSVYGQGPPIEAHLAYLRARFDDRSLLMGGPLATAMSGFAVLDVPDLRAAQAFARADPAVAAGVLAYQLDEWVPYFDAISAARSTGPAADLALRGRRAATA